MGVLSLPIAYWLLQIGIKPAESSRERQIALSRFSWWHFFCVGASQLQNRAHPGLNFFEN
jgi:hypothetical protein